MTINTQLLRAEFKTDVTAENWNYTRKTIEPVHVCAKSQHMYFVLIGLFVLLLEFYRLPWLNELQTTL